MTTSTTFILAITTAGGPSTELQVVQISVIKSRISDALAKVNICPQTGKRRLYPSPTLKQRVIGLPGAAIVLFGYNSIASVGYIGSYTAIFIQQAVSMLERSL
jgi:hypothetical protein